MDDHDEKGTYDLPEAPDPQHAMILHGPDGSIWYVVAEVGGLVNAEVIAGLLRAARIPVYLYREAAGSSALPLTVGMLGAVTVAVPEIYYAEALALLDAENDLFPELDEGLSSEIADDDEDE